VTSCQAEASGQRVCDCVRRKIILRDRHEIAAAKPFCFLILALSSFQEPSAGPARGGRGRRGRRAYASLQAFPAVGERRAGDEVVTAGPQRDDPAFEATVEVDGIDTVDGVRGQRSLETPKWNAEKRCRTPGWR
jgi:hypothetical protein